jgi:hypothetical protein
VTDAVLSVSRGGYQPAGSAHFIAFPDKWVSLGSGTDISVAVSYEYRIIQTTGVRSGWEAITTAYHFALADSDQREILAYHLHPHVTGAEFPHLHLSYGLIARDILALAGLSLPTQRTA